MPIKNYFLFILLLFNMIVMKSWIKMLISIKCYKYFFLIYNLIIITVVNVEIKNHTVPKPRYLSI